jgi:Cu/Ag efflux pump CusA
VLHDVRQRLGRIQFPLEYHAELLGAPGAAQQRELSIVVAAAIGVFLLLQAAFGSWRLAALVFATLPLALVGGALAAFAFGGGELTSTGSVAGLLGVLAIAVRHAILLVRRCQRLAEDGEQPGPGLVLRAARERLVPVTLTALTAALALAPSLLLGGAPGMEVVRPLAVVVLGGLATSTPVGLLLLPFLYLRFAPRLEQGQPEAVLRLTPAP